MRKRIILLSLAALLIAALPLVAVAADETEMTTVITYTVDDPNAEPPPPSAPSNDTSVGYTVIIPASITLPQENGFVIRAENVVLSSGQFLAVVLESARSFANDGYFYINNGGTDAVSRIRTDVQRADVDQPRELSVSLGGLGHLLVAEFRNGDTTPCKGGKLFFTASPNTENLPGTYTGTIYFRISIEHDNSTMLGW